MLGKKVLPQRTGSPNTVSADGYPEWLDIGVNISWELVTAAVSLTTLADGTQVHPGEKAILRGTVLVPVTTAEEQTIDLSGDDDPAGGTWELNIFGTTLEDLEYNISAADLQTAIRAIDAPYADLVTVTKLGFVYTLVYSTKSGNAAAPTADATGLTGGSGDTFAITITTTVAGVDYAGKWAPFDGSKSDGRQTLARGYVGILDQTLKDSELSVLGADPQTELTGLIEGGLVWRERLVVDGSNQPTTAGLLAVMPRLRLTRPE